MLGFKVTGLVPVPDKTGKFGNRGLRVKTMDIADFSDDTSGVDLANAGMEVNVLGMISNCCSMALSRTLTCFSKARIEAIETAIA